MKILLVDDEPLELDQLEYLITPSFPNWSFYKCRDASEALQLAKEHRFYLAFLDIQMPGKNGLELAKEFKKTQEFDIIMVTAFQTFEYAQEGLRIGVNDYITKPIIESELLEVLKRYEHWNTYSKVIFEALIILHEEYSKKITLSSIAERIHLNPTYLSRKFFEEIGMGFAEYLNSYRLDISKKLLAELKDYSMSIVAEKCGFNSQHYFSSMFRKKFGVTPSEYRAQIKNMHVIS